MATEIEICNQALLRVGGDFISSLEDDQKESALCKTMYPMARDHLMGFAHWSFLSGRAILSPSSTSPAFGFENAFEIPGDVLEIYEVFDNDRYNPDLVKNELYWQREGNLILADVDTIYVKYKAKTSDPSKYPAQYTQALVAYLAHLLAVPVSSNRNLANEMYSLYERAATEAANTDSMQGRSRKLRMSSFVDVRKF